MSLLAVAPVRAPYEECVDNRPGFGAEDGFDRDFALTSMLLEADEVKKFALDRLWLRGATSEDTRNASPPDKSKLGVRGLDRCGEPSCCDCRDNESERERE